MIPSATATTLEFKGSKICVPLPPSVWADSSEVLVELAIMRLPEVEVDAVGFDSLRHAARSSPRATPSAPQKVFHAVLNLRPPGRDVQGLEVDQTKALMNIYLSLAEAAPTKNHILTNQIERVDGNPAVVVADLTLRDRDHVRIHGKNCSLYVGDRAMLQLEEPLIYPASVEQFRRRAVPGTFEPSNAGTRPWMAPLRKPARIHEYTASGLVALHERFTRGNLPRPDPEQKYIQDLIPYRYVMPQSEADFLAAGKAGTFWRIMEQMAADPEKDSTLIRLPLPQCLPMEPFNEINSGVLGNSRK